MQVLCLSLLSFEDSDSLDGDSVASLPGVTLMLTPSELSSLLVFSLLISILMLLMLQLKMSEPTYLAPVIDLRCSPARLAIKTKTRRARLCWASFGLYQPCRIRPIFNAVHLLEWIGPLLSAFTLDPWTSSARRLFFSQLLGLLASF